jgi:hypothetical protein
MDPPDLATLRQNFYWQSQNYHHTRALYLAAVNSQRPIEEQRQLLDEWHTAVQRLDMAMNAFLDALDTAEDTPRNRHERQRTLQIRELLDKVRELDPIPEEPDPND